MNLADKIIEELFYYPNSSKELLRDYVTGISSDMPQEIPDLRVPYFYSEHERRFCFEEDYGSNAVQKEMVIRLVKLLEIKQPKQLYQYFKWTDNRFQYYKDAAVSKAFVLGDLDETIAKLEKEDFFRGLQSIRRMVHGVVLHYPELAEELEAQYPVLHGQQKAAAALCAAVRRSSLTEGKILPELIEAAFSPNAKEKTQAFLYQYLYFCQGLSKQVDLMAKELLLRCPEGVYRQFTAENRQEFGRLCSAFHTGDEPLLSYLLSRICHDWENDRQQDMEEIRNVTSRDSRALPAAYSRFCQEGDSRALVACALMKNTDDKGRVDELILKCISWEYQNFPEEFPLFFFSDKEGDFSSLLVEDPGQVRVTLNPEIHSLLRWNPERYGWFRLVLSCSMVLDISAAAINLVCLTAKALQGEALVYLRLYENSKYFSLVQGNRWEELYRQGLPFSILCRAGVASKCQFYGYQRPQRLWSDFEEFLPKHRDETECEVRDSHMDSSQYLIFIHLVYGKDSGFDYGCLAPALGSSSKEVSEFVEKTLRDKEAAARQAVEEIVQSGPRMAANGALRLLRLWDNKKTKEILAKLPDLDSVCEYIEKQYTKSNEKNVPYPKIIDYGCVRSQDSAQCLPPAVMKFYISEYILLKELYLIGPCDEIRRLSNPYDLQNLIRQIYEAWLSEGAGIKYKNILLPYALNAGNTQLEVLKKQIDEWCQNSKPGLAVFAVSCLAFNGSQVALMMVDAMAKNHKNKRVKKAAAEALIAAMDNLGLSKEEFEDLIVPDLGFSSDRTRFFSYGTRQFKAVLGTDLSVTLYDGEKAIRSLPKASEKYDDVQEQAEAAKEELKSVKKQLKTVVDYQRVRMDQAIVTQRRWPRKRWDTLFIGNPLMFSFACGQVWQEMGGEGNPYGTFRYMEDGSFNTADEEEYEFHEDSFISLVHPADLDAELLQTWKSQLEDYEVDQPVKQLSLPVPDFDAEVMAGELIPGFEDKSFYSATVRSVAGKLGCELLYEDYGECSGLRRTFEKERLTVSVHVTSFNPGEYDAATAILEIVFAGEDGQRLVLDSVPKRILSFAYQAAIMLTAKSVTIKSS